MTADFLTAAEVEHWTGRKQGAAQARWLKSRHIRHWVNAAGHVVVPRSALEPRERKAAEPNFDAIREMAG